jgi:uncharacterized protein (TIGR02145 family)
MKKIILFFVILIINVKISKAQFIDIDGNEYKTVLIRNQTWMAENLKIVRFRNGDLIPLAKSYVEFEHFGKEQKPAMFIDTGASKNIFVRYNWYAVNDARGLAPEGWHIPNRQDFLLLSNLSNLWNSYGPRFNLDNPAEGGESWFHFSTCVSDGSKGGIFFSSYDYSRTGYYCVEKERGYFVRFIKNEDYKEFKIGNKIFMAKNLNSTRFRNGDSIFFAKNIEEWHLAGRQEIPAYRYSNFDNSENNNGNMLYNFFAVKDERGLAPFGWRIPNLEDIYSIRDEKKDNELVHLLNKNNKSKGNVWGWWTSDYAMENELGRGILQLGGYIIHSSSNFIHTNERYLPEDAFNVMCIKE